MTVRRELLSGECLAHVRYYRGGDMGEGGQPPQIFYYSCTAKYNISPPLQDQGCIATSLVPRLPHDSV